MKIPVFITVFGLFLAMSGCHTSTSPQGSGTIAGRVILFDSTGTVLTDFSGIYVSVDVTPMSMVTDPSGDWQFSGLSDGIYDVTATKAGFGTYHWYEQDVAAGRVGEPTAALSQMSSYTPIVAGVTINSRILSVDILGYSQFPSGLPLGANIAGYCDLDSNVAPSDSHLLVAINTDYNSGGGIYFSYNDLLSAGARPGQTLYLSAANVFLGYNGISVGYHTTFADPYHNNTLRYASNGPKSNVIAVTMP